MATTTFIDGQTPIVSAWLNDVNNITYNKTFSDGTIALSAEPGSLLDSSAVSYVPSGTGEVSTTVQTKLRQTISVMDFGADPTGTIDATTAFTNAISYCNTNNCSLFAPAPSSSYLIGSALNISCPFESGVYKLFSGSGQVTFSHPTVTEVYPEWWGAVAVPNQNSSSVLQTPNDCTTAIVSAMNSVRFNYVPSGKIVKFGIGVYGVSSIEIVTSTDYVNGLTLRGTRSTQNSASSSSNVGAGGSSVLRSVTSSSYMISLDATSGNPVFETHYEDLTFDGNCQKNAVFLMNPGSTSSSYTVNFHYFDRCVFINQNNTKTLIQSNTSNVHSENALIYFNQCSFLINSVLQPTYTGIAVFLQNPGAWQWQFDQCYFSGNSTSGFASIYVQTGGAQLNNCYFEDNTNYDLTCLDGGWIHAYSCQTISGRFAYFGTYSGSATYTSSRGIIIEDLIFGQTTPSGTWAILSDSALQNISIKNLNGGGVYLRSGAANALIENVYGGNIEFGNRGDSADTYTGKAVLINVPGIDTYGGSTNTTPMGAVTIVEGTDATVLDQKIALDLVSYLSTAYSSGLTSWIISSYKQSSSSYQNLTIRALQTIFDAGEIKLSVPGDGVIMTTPDGTHTYRVSINNSGSVITTMVS